MAAHPSQRTLLATAAPLIAQSRRARAAIVQTDFSKLWRYGNGMIPAGIRSRPIVHTNGLSVHILEAGYEAPRRAQYAGFGVILPQGARSVGRQARRC